MYQKIVEVVSSYRDGKVDNEGSLNISDAEEANLWSILLHIFMILLLQQSTNTQSNICLLITQIYSMP